MKNSLIIAGLSMLALASCSTTKTYTINSKSGTQTQGTAKFTQSGKYVKMDLNAYKLTPGKHAVHIHDFGDCSATDASSAGGHWNPTSEKHVKWDVNEYHKGDIGNMIVDKNGTGRVLFETDKWCFGCSDVNKNIIGRSIVIHDKEDDFHTQPTGNAGGRVGCIEIK